MSRRAVFLDRDGVINRAVVREGKPYPPASVGEVEILPGVSKALAQLKAAGFVLVVVSNQPDVARGTMPRKTVEAINAELAGKLPLDDFRMCYHDGNDGCDCRKPQPGMLLAAAREFGISLCDSFMVGDRWRDVEAGRRAGCKTLFIDYGYDEQQPKACDYRVKSLLEAGEIISSLHNNSVMTCSGFQDQR
jgi:D-glycero-D-manno-heptose 1,7-bisphosphate phosphatase